MKGERKRREWKESKERKKIKYYIREKGLKEIK